LEIEKTTSLRQATDSRRFEGIHHFGQTLHTFHVCVRGCARASLCLTRSLHHYSLTKHYKLDLDAIMATENKRQSVAGKGPGAAVANLGPSGMVSLETALSGAIGARYEISLMNPAFFRLQTEDIGSRKLETKKPTNTIFEITASALLLPPQARIPWKAPFSPPVPSRT
jgi:hypothetical protein